MVIAALKEHISLYNLFTIKLKRIRVIFYPKARLHTGDSWLLILWTHNRFLVYNVPSADAFDCSYRLLLIFEMLLLLIKLPRIRCVK